MNSASCMKPLTECFTFNLILVRFSLMQFTPNLVLILLLEEVKLSKRDLTCQKHPVSLSLKLRELLTRIKEKSENTHQHTPTHTHCDYVYLAHQTDEPSTLTQTQK